jgi:hypothetical protein
MNPSAGHLRRAIALFRTEKGEGSIAATANYPHLPAIAL